MKRVLYLAYYFPPAGGPGVQRTLKFVRYLPRNGWLPTVITVTPDRAAWPATDESLMAEVPETVSVHRTNSWDPYAAYAALRGRRKEESVGVGFADEHAPGVVERLSRFIRANVFLPDARVGWNRFASQAVKQAVASDTYSAVISTGPPHSTHLVGRWVSKRFGLPWLADFRDPWGELSYYDQLPFLPWSRALDRRMERRVLRDADDVVTVSTAVAELLAAKRKRSVRVIPNGFDPADFEGVQPLIHSGFEIVYVGTMTAPQNPTRLWACVRGMREAGSDVRVRFVGRVDAEVRAGIDRAGITDAVTLTPYVPHQEAVAYMLGADVLLMSVPQTREARGILTGKVFEYLYAGRPILGIGPVGSDVAELVAEADAGMVVDYEDGPAMESFMMERYTAWAAGRPVRPTKTEVVARYSREALTAVLADRLNNLSAE